MGGHPVVGGLAGGKADIGVDVDLLDAIPHDVAEILIRQPGPAVQHQRRVGHLADGAQALQIQHRNLLVHAVGGADGDGQGVHPGAGDEVGHVLGLGVGIACVLFRIEDHMAQLALDGHAPLVGIVGHAAQVFHVLVIGQLALVKHHGGEAIVDGLLDHRLGEAMVQVDGHRHLGAISQRFQHAGDQVQVAAVEQRLGCADDHGGAQLLGGLHHAQGHFGVEGVEHAHPIVAGPGVAENLLGCDQHVVSSFPSLALWFGIYVNRMCPGHPLS